MNTFYIYLHIKQTNGEPFYVGKGKGQRAHTKQYRNTFWHNIVNKHGYDIIFLEENLSEEIAIEQEQYWITRIGRRDLHLGTLVNLTDGGDGQTGYVYTPTHRLNMSNAQKGRTVTDITKEKISIAHKGKKHKSDRKYSKHKQHKQHIFEKDVLKNMSDKNKNNMLSYWKNLTDDEYAEKIKNVGRKKYPIKVIQLTKNEELIKIWDSHYDAAVALDSTKPNYILDVCNGNKKSHKGYFWRKSE